MRKWLPIAAAVLVVLLLVAAGAFWFAYRASQQVPEFYQRAMAVEPAVQQAGSDQMLQRSTALVSDAKKAGRWQALFTEEQINGWLAVDLVQNHSNALPPTISDPRLSIEPDRVTLACRVRQGRWHSVLSLTIDVYLSAPDTVALRFRKARAGTMPLPLDSLLAQAAESARRARWRVNWSQSDGDPVALLPLQPVDKNHATLNIDTLSLRKGEIYVAGTTKRR